MSIDIQTIDLEALKRTALRVFDQPDYDALLSIAILLFGKSCVTINFKNNTIKITDKIHLLVSLSRNECKAYFYSYITPKEYDFPKQADIRSAFMNQNYPFRLFALETMVEYLKLKAQENAFIKQNEG